MSKCVILPRPPLHAHHMPTTSRISLYQNSFTLIHFAMAPKEKKGANDATSEAIAQAKKYLDMSVGARKESASNNEEKKYALTPAQKHSLSNYGYHGVCDLDIDYSRSEADDMFVEARKHYHQFQRDHAKMKPITSECIVVYARRFVDVNAFDHMQSTRESFSRSSSSKLKTLRNSTSRPSRMPTSPTSRPRSFGVFTPLVSALTWLRSYLGVTPVEFRPCSSRSLMRLGRQ